MTMLLEAAVLAVAAAATAWPGDAGRVRQRRLGLAGRVGSPVTAAAVRGTVSRALGAPRVVAAVAVGTGTVFAVFAGGPVAGLVVGAYAGLAGRAVLRRRQATIRASRRAQTLDDLADLAAELRAGRPVPARLLAPAGAPGTGDTVRARAAAAAALAEETGAPLADLLERIETDARAADRAAAMAAAQIAGARATAVLLAGLPAAGIAIGYGIGADPLHVLLRTPLGAGCAAAAVALQLAGLAWVSRITAAGSAA